MNCQAWPPREQAGCIFSWYDDLFQRNLSKVLQTNSTGISIWLKNRCLLYWCKISRWCDEKLLCCHRVKICKFRTKRQGVNQFFHLHARAPPTAVPWVDERMATWISGGISGWSLCLKFVIYQHFSWCYVARVESRCMINSLVQNQIW